jgi:hypothetical protein
MTLLGEIVFVFFLDTGNLGILTKKKGEIKREILEIRHCQKFKIIIYFKESNSVIYSFHEASSCELKSWSIIY